jgi:DNA-binding protein YbaB
MKGVTFLEDTTNNKKLVQIDLAILQKNDDEYLQDILDAIIAES